MSPAVDLAPHQIRRTSGRLALSRAHKNRYRSPQPRSRSRAHSILGAVRRQGPLAAALVAVGDLPEVSDDFELDRVLGITPSRCDVKTSQKQVELDGAIGSDLNRSAWWRLRR